MCELGTTSVLLTVIDFFLWTELIHVTCPGTGRGGALTPHISCSAVCRFHKSQFYTIKYVCWVEAAIK